MGEESTAGTIARYLRDVKNSLESAGFTATINAPCNRAPYLRAGNRHAPVLSETVRVDHHIADGDALWFFFSWGEPICPARETERAARELGNVLRSR